MLAADRKRNELVELLQRKFNEKAPNVAFF